MFSSRKEAAATGEPTSPNSGTGLRAHRHPPTDTYSPIVGSVNPIQMYILENAHSPTHPPTDAYFPIVGKIYPIPLYKPPKLADMIA